LARYPADDWVKRDIDKRDGEFVERIVTFFRTNL
jgi:hypothetical protein